MPKIIARALAILTPKERHSFIPLVIMMVVGALLESFGVTMVIPVVAGIMDGSQLTEGTFGAVLRALFGEQDAHIYLAILLVIMIGIFVFKNAFLLWRTYVQSKITARIRARVQNRLLHYHLSRSYSFFLTSDSGDILRTITVDSDYFYALLTHILNFLTSVILTVIMAAVVFVIDPQMAFVITVVLAIEYLIILHFIRPYLRKQGKLYRSALGHGNGVIIELLRGIKDIKIGRKEGYFEKRYGEDVEQLVHARMVEQAFGGVPARLIEAVTVSALLVYLLVLLFAGAEMSELVPILSAFVLAAAKILPCIGNISSSVSYANYYEGTLERVREIDDALRAEEAAPASSDAEFVGNGAFDSFESIRLRDIVYQYPTGEEPVLDGFDIAILRNQSVGITGASGAGKTTAVDVLLGLLEVQSGTIELDGAPIDPTDPAWQRLFSYIPQEVFILSGTIRDNVVFGHYGSADVKVPDEDVWAALEAAQLADYVRSLSGGLDEEVGEAGIRLSGGQAQRLGIARAVFSNAPILVFDEATSALDYETEAALMEAISGLRGTKTLVIIAHRLTTVENCDLVYRVEGGKAFVDRG